MAIIHPPSFSLGVCDVVLVPPLPNICKNSENFIASAARSSPAPWWLPVPLALLWLSPMYFHEPFILKWLPEKVLTIICDFKMQGKHIFKHLPWSKQHSVLTMASAMCCHCIFLRHSRNGLCILSIS